MSLLAKRLRVATVRRSVRLNVGLDENSLIHAF